MTPSNNTRTCDIMTDTCTFGCKHGYFGENCSFICPDKCGASNEPNTTTCSIENECLHGCQIGYTGRECSIQCPKNCIGPSKGSNSPVCNATSMECFFGCNPGFYGLNCSQTCTNVISGCQICHQENGSTNVVCTRCSPNFYTDTNNNCKQCSYWCSDRHDIDTCNHTNGECDGCKTGRYGRWCENPCSSTCKNSVCDKYSGSCINGCNLLRYCGKMCQSLCNEGCVDQICESDCTCSRGCNPNNWGKRCENDCTEDCLSPSTPDFNICSRKDGSCIHGCASKALWGSQCTRDCSENCLNGTCEQISGNCTGGCTNNRVFGIACDQECPTNCMNKTCRKHDGYCEEGCVFGYYGVQCDRKCNIHCRNDSCERYEGLCSSCESGWFGMECEYPCKKSCMNKECHPLTGFCVYGCIGGYQGDSCDEALTVSRTDLVIAIVEGILFLMLMTVVIYLIRNNKGCKDIVNKLSRKGKRSEDCTGINRESNAYMELNRHNEADHTAMPYETLDMNTTSDTGLVPTTTAPGITTTAKN